MNPTATHRERLRWLRDLLQSGDRSECWEWPGHRNGPLGYGRMYWNGAHLPITHVVLELAGRPRPDQSLIALHSCDNAPCVNPDHLGWGTPLDNMTDKVVRGRCPAGDNHACRKVTSVEVMEIRQRVAAGEPIRRIVHDYPIGRQAIQHIVHRRSWKDVA